MRILVPAFVVVLSSLIPSTAHAFTSEPVAVSLADAPLLFGTTAVALDPDATLVAPTSAFMQNLTVSFDGAFAPQDVLSCEATAPTTSCVWSGARGLLQISADSIADYQAALRTVRFSTSLGQSVHTPRQVRVTTSDAIAFVDAAGNLRAVEYIGVSSTPQRAVTSCNRRSQWSFRGYVAPIPSAEQNAFAARLAGTTAWFDARSEAGTIDWTRLNPDTNANELIWQGGADGAAVNGAYANWAANEPIPSPDDSRRFAFLNADGQWATAGADDSAPDGVFCQFGRLGGEIPSDVTDVRTIRLDVDVDGVFDDVDANPTDPCIPVDSILACPTGDIDGDRTPNADDSAPSDPCAPNANSITCETGDFDGDTFANNVDDDAEDGCVPNPNNIMCGTGDLDNDGLTNAAEMAAGTNPTAPDSDGDGVLDGADTQPLDVCGPEVDNLACGVGDFDSDGISNGAEADAGTNPANADSDGDGVDDGDDAQPVNECQPAADNLACGTGDFDGDGATNEEEAEAGSDPTNPDSDGDGINDGDDPQPIGGEGEGEEGEGEEGEGEEGEGEEGEGEGEEGEGEEGEGEEGEGEEGEGEEGEGEEGEGEEGDGEEGEGEEGEGEEGDGEEGEGEEGEGEEGEGGEGEGEGDTGGCSATNNRSTTTSLALVVVALLRRRRQR